MFVIMQCIVITAPKQCGGNITDVYIVLVLARNILYAIVSDMKYISINTLLVL